MMKRTTKISVLAICLAIALLIVPAMAVLPDNTESGIFRDGLWALDTTGDHQADDYYILGQVGDFPVAGDGWSGIFRDGLWALDTTGDNQADVYYIHGQAGDLPVVGDGWIGIFRDGLWAMMELDAPQDVTYEIFGMAGDIPVYRATEDGYQIGIFRPSNGLWAFTDGVTVDYFVHGMDGDLPAVGDDYYAIFRNGLWATLDSESQVDYYILGMAGDRPVVPFPTAEPTPLEVVSVEAITATTVNATFSAPATADQAGEYEWDVQGVEINFETTATATVAEGDELVEATLAAALPESGNYTLDGVEFAWTEPVDMYDVTFTVVDGEDVAIEDATVDLDGVEQLTDINGTAVFSVEAGEYNWSVSKTGYVTEEAIGLLVEDNVTVPVTLVNEVQEALDAVNAATTDAATRDAFVLYADVLGLNLVDYNKFTAYQRTTIIANAVRVNKPDGGYTSGAQIQDEIDTAAFDQILKAQLNADVTTNLIEQYPYTLGLDLSDYNTYVPFANRTGTGDINPKEEVAVLLNTTNPFTNTTQVEVNFTNVIGGWNAVIAVNNANEDNIVAVLNANVLALKDVPAPAGQVSLTNENFTRWANLTADRQELVAFKVLDGTTDPILGTPYETVLELTNATNKAIDEEFAGDVDDAVDAVNAATAQTMRSTLETNANILGIASLAAWTSYVDFPDGTKDLVAADVFDNRPASPGYADAAAIRTAFTNAVNGIAIIEVNAATDAPEMQTALEIHKTGLNLDPQADGEPTAANRWQYYILPENDRNAVAGGVLDTRPALPAGYATAVAIAAAFNTSVNTTSEEIAVEVINAFVDDVENYQGMRTTLETTFYAFGINTSQRSVLLNITEEAGYYNQLPSGNKDAVAIKMLEHLDQDGIYTGNATQAALNITKDFLDAVVEQKGALEPVAVQAVNVAAIRPDMHSALNQYKEIINITEVYDGQYTALPETGTRTSKNAVLDRMIAGRNYNNVNEIKVNFTANVTIASINNAADAAAIRTIIETNRSAEALEILTYTGEYNDLITARKTNVATAVMNGGRPYALSNATGVKAVFDAAVTEQKAEQDASAVLTDINSATNKEDVLHLINATANRTALGVEGYAAGYPADQYGLWNASIALPTNRTKLDNVAQAIYLNKTYADSTAFRTIFNRYVAFEVLNNLTATNNTNERTAVQNFSGFIPLDTGTGSNWHALTAENQTAAATGFYTASYATIPAMQTAFNANVTRELLNQSVWAINSSIATGAYQDTRTVLTNTSYAEVLEIALPTGDTPEATKQRNDIARTILDDQNELRYLNSTGTILLNNNTLSAANITRAVNAIQAINVATPTGLVTLVQTDNLQLAVNRSDARDMTTAMTGFDGFGLNRTAPTNMAERINATTNYQTLVAEAVIDEGTFQKFIDFNNAFNQSVSDWGNVTTNITNINIVANAVGDNTADMIAAITMFNSTTYGLEMPEWGAADTTTQEDAADYLTEQILAETPNKEFLTVDRIRDTILAYLNA